MWDFGPDDSDGVQFDWDALDYLYDDIAVNDYENEGDYGEGFDDE